MTPDPSTVLPVGATPTDTSNSTNTYSSLTQPGTGTSDPYGFSTSVPTSIPSSAIKPANPVNVPTASNPDLSVGYLGQVNADQANAQSENDTQSSTVTGGINNLSSLYDTLSGKTADTQKLQNDYGTVNMQNNINDLNATAQQQQALYLQGVQNINNKVISQGERGQAETEATRQHGIDSLLTNSLISASQNKLTAATTQIERALALKYDPIVAKIDAQSKILDKNMTLLSASNQKLAAAKLAQNEALKTQLATEVTQKKDAITVATTSITSGIVDQTTGYKAISDLANGKITLSDFYAQLGLQAPASPTQSQGNLPQRNNNPGNLKDTSGSFKVFSSPEQGFQALKNDLMAKMTGATSTGLTANSSLLDFSKVYAPSSDNNNPTQYAQNLAKQLGVSSDTKIGTLKNRVDDFANAIAQNEGFNASTSARYGKLSGTSFNPDSKVDALANQYLDNYLKNGAIPSMASLGITARTGGGTAMYQRLQARANDLFFEATGQSLPDVQILKGNKALIVANNKLANNLNIQEDTVAKNFALSIENLDKNGINQNSPPINAFLDKMKNLMGSPEVAQYLAQNTTVANELGSLLAVKNASGTTVADKLEASGLVPKGASEAQQKAILKVLLQEAENAQTALKDVSSNLYSQVDPLSKDPNNPERAKLVNPEGTEMSNASIISRFRNTSPENDKMATDLRARFPNATATQLRQALNLPAYE